MDHNGIFITPNLNVTWGDHIEDIVGERSKLRGQNLTDELFKVLPQVGKQTYFYNKFGEV